MMIKYICIQSGTTNFFFMSKQTTRKIKLQPKTRALTRSQKIVPELRINGVWLQRSGFAAGQTVEITVRENQLIIKPAYTQASADKPAS